MLFSQGVSGHGDKILKGQNVSECTPHIILVQVFLLLLLMNVVFIKINKYLEVEGSETIFAGGDCLQDIVILVFLKDWSHSVCDTNEGICNYHIVLAQKWSKR